MAPRKYTKQQIDHFNDRIGNVLNDIGARSDLEEYLKKYKFPVQSKVLRLWNKANSSKWYRRKDFQDDIEDIDGFSTKGLGKSIDQNSSEDDDSDDNDEETSEGEPGTDSELIFIKQECCRILEKIRPQFIKYLTINKM